ncbi:aspartyl-phosphate phosphatase Spo0E family protein [Alkalicoccobacillus gibsonii]|uniref:Aspartyl-phosphate phosphatase Spo0E family protein n=1 Tax=Alkalicoccobacillus gibsonii TaxID=79881 RepID=A0ABU9VIK5_9BACI
MKYQEIEWKRRQMFLLAEKYGMTSERTIRCSQELDLLLNDIQHRLSANGPSSIR